MVDVPVSPGELCDRLVILGLKTRRIPDERRRAVAADLLAELQARWCAAGLPDWTTLPEWEALSEVNAGLWEVEEQLREHEARADFGERFVALARSVYQLNDRRAALKATIDAAAGSSGTEPKWYAARPDGN